MNVTVKETKWNELTSSATKQTSESNNFTSKRELEHFYKTTSRSLQKEK